MCQTDALVRDRGRFVAHSSLTGDLAHGRANKKPCLGKISRCSEKCFGNSSLERFSVSSLKTADLALLFLRSDVSMYPRQPLASCSYEDGTFADLVHQLAIQVGDK